MFFTVSPSTSVRLDVERRTRHARITCTWPDQRLKFDLASFSLRDYSHTVVLWYPNFLFELSLKIHTFAMPPSKKTSRGKKRPAEESNSQEFDEPSIESLAENLEQ